MDTKVEYHILLIKSFIYDNSKSTSKKQKDTADKPGKIYKWMENLMDIFENTSPKNVETNRPQYSSSV